MLVYILKIVLIQAIGLGIHFLLLRNQKIFGYTRTFLWTLIVSSFVIPFIEIPVFEQVEIVSQINNLPQVIELSAITNSENAPQSTNWVLLLWIGIGVISLIQLVRLFFSYKKIIRLKKTATFIEPNIYASDSIQLPFSFVQSIYIPSSFIDKKELPFILAHEQVHIDKRHSRDKIIITLLARVFWFNPLFIIFHKELELIHEYQVDDSVTQNHKLEDYLKSLLQSTIYIQTSPIALTHSFFSSPIKNRIIMLHKKAKQTTSKKMLSAASLLMLVLTFLFVQAATSKAQTAHVPPTPPPPPSNIPPPPPAPVTEDGRNDVDENAEYPGGNAAMMKFIGNNMKFTKAEREGIPAGVIYLRFIVGADGKVGNVKSVRTPNGLELLEEKAIAAVLKMPKWKSAIKDGKNVKSEFALPVSFQPDTTSKSVESTDMDTTYVEGNDGRINMVVTDKNVKPQIRKPKVHTNIRPKYARDTSYVEQPNGEIHMIISDKIATANFPGGTNALAEYLSKNIHYPKWSKEKGIEGKIYIEFAIDKNGKIHSSRAFKNTPESAELIGEALRVVNEMPNWEPAYKESGETVKSKMVLPIIFKL